MSVDARARPAFDQAKDYYTSEEAAQFMKPKKKVGACDVSLSKRRQLLAWLKACRKAHIIYRIIQPSV